MRSLFFALAAATGTLDMAKEQLPPILPTNDEVTEQYQYRRAKQDLVLYP
jgi:hypothetical protein